MKTYYIRTDSSHGTIKAENLDAAIADYFADESPTAKTLDELKEKFQKYAADGAWCFIYEGDVRVVEIGSDK